MGIIYVRLFFYYLNVNVKVELFVKIMEYVILKCEKINIC